MFVNIDTIYIAEDFFQEGSWGLGGEVVSNSLELKKKNIM